MKRAICVSIWEDSYSNKLKKMWDKMVVGKSYSIRKTSVMGYSVAIMSEDGIVCALNSMVGDKHFKVIEIDTHSQGI